MPQRFVSLLSALCLVMSGLAIFRPALAAPDAPAGPTQAPTFRPNERAVTSWRREAAGHLVLAADQIAALRGTGAAPRVARCVKLNNYWCIKTAGWDGELATDGEGHVAFASAVEGAAVAALLLRRYYIDFDRKTAMAIISRWAPAQCGGAPGVASAAPQSAVRTTRTRRLASTTAPLGLGNTLRARWLSTHARGFVTPVAGRAGTVKRSAVADRGPRMMPTPTIAVGLGEAGKPMTLDAMMMSSPNAPPSRSMIGMPRWRGARIAAGSGFAGCSADSTRIANYATNAAAGIRPGPGGDLELFDAAGAPTANLKIMMANMARVEIGPLGPTAELIDAGIAAAFRPGRNPPRP